MSNLENLFSSQAEVRILLCGILSFSSRFVLDPRSRTFMIICNDVLTLVNLSLIQVLVFIIKGLLEEPLSRISVESM